MEGAIQAAGSSHTTDHPVESSTAVQVSSSSGVCRAGAAPAGSQSGDRTGRAERGDGNAASMATMPEEGWRECTLQGFHLELGPNGEVVGPRPCEFRMMRTNTTTGCNQRADLPIQPTTASNRGTVAEAVYWCTKATPVARSIQGRPRRSPGRIPPRVRACPGVGQVTGWRSCAYKRSHV